MNHDWVRCDHATPITWAGMAGCSGEARLTAQVLRVLLLHHRGAIALLDVVLANGSTGGVCTAAQKVKTVQAR